MPSGPPTDGMATSRSGSAPANGISGVGVAARSLRAGLAEAGIRPTVPVASALGCGAAAAARSTRAGAGLAESGDNPADEPAVTSPAAISADTVTGAFHRISATPPRGPVRWSHAQRVPGYIPETRATSILRIHLRQACLRLVRGFPVLVR